MEDEAQKQRELDEQRRLERWVWSLDLMTCVLYGIDGIMLKWNLAYYSTILCHLENLLPVCGHSYVCLM